mmetsp:Transcript_24153/g.52711  ORF Transcript_24153/g.52711 Transcript_24153/m.52711 type:complete len:546 (-) Transcript_24153:91-1728(-)|eukprot:CAMPEP_0118938364 /NCGR_PEP_ID=MMETSP1169-20130426/25606_1 /TAXON_ID=36882 /ORGANISM="Pyramimonas obovata, Strain CCMP722" /LENGTH=545 /DNA_ID=CAMNT_0006882265 /DNA_START=161 /DNA_END=1798 /DNA_ORIENTATION=+
MRDGLRLQVGAGETAAAATAAKTGSNARGHSEDLPAAQKRFPSSKLKLDELFLQWISMPESQKLVLSLLDDSKMGRPLSGPNGLSAMSPLSPSSTSALFSATPPLSPSKVGSPPRSPLSPTKRSVGASAPIPRGAHHLPQFYFPNGRPASQEAIAAVNEKLNVLFGKKALNVDQFVAVTKEVVELPSFFNQLLFSRIDTQHTGTVTREQFMDYWRAKLERADISQRAFEVLRQPGVDYLVHEDFQPIMHVILETHPGLEFLKEAPEFQERYAETVIYRIFYSVNRKGDRRITLRELKRSDLLEVMMMVAAEEDINKVLKYFSYEHFYVIYCKFWELDTDHDFYIDREDLLRYGNHALTYRIVDRIFSQAPRKFVSGVEGKMGYEDFCWFILSEEDKSTALSLEYWYTCIDLDLDKRIVAAEMRYFYEEQLHRMECLSQEPVLFEDILCQLSDMVKPAQEGVFTLTDLKGCKLAGNFFNILFNLNKFIAFETRDPFLIRQEREDPHLTEWDRFARMEYVRLSMEEEGEDASNGSAEVLDDSMDAPF